MEQILESGALPLASYPYDSLSRRSGITLGNGAGNLQKAYSYSPFGETNITGAVGNSYLFTGRRLDPESRLYYYRARHYDAKEGRFMQPDPIGFEGGIDLYSYVLNNPVNWIVPWGQDTYKIDRELGGDEVKNKNNPWSHSYIVITGSDGKVLHTYRFLLILNYKMFGNK